VAPLIRGPELRPAGQPLPVGAAVSCCGRSSRGPQCGFGLTDFPRRGTSTAIPELRSRSSTCAEPFLMAPVRGRVARGSTTLAYGGSVALSDRKRSSQEDSRSEPRSTRRGPYYGITSALAGGIPKGFRQ
jgi:hypothetical protein